MWPLLLNLELYDWASPPNLKELLPPMVTTAVVWYNYNGTYVNMNEMFKA